MRCRGVFSHSSPDPLLPALVGLLALNNPPAPGRREELAAVGLRLRALNRSACFLSCRVALSLSLVRYCGSVRRAGEVLLGLFYSVVKTFQCDGGMDRSIASFVVPPVLVVCFTLLIRMKFLLQ